MNDVDQIDSSSKDNSPSPSKKKMSVKDITAKINLDIISDKEESLESSSRDLKAESSELSLKNE